MHAVNDDLDLSLRQMCGAWRLMTRDCAAPTVDAVGDVEYIFSNLPVAFFNIVVPTGRAMSAAALQDLGSQAVARVSGKALPWMFMVTHEALEPGVEPTACLDACGLAPALPLTGMSATRLTPAAGVPAGLELTVPQDDAGCGTVIDLNSAAYEMDLGAVKPVLGSRAFWAEHVPVLGLVDGTPASSAAVMMVDGVRYVALVATDPARRRRGYADAAMRRALELAAAKHGEVLTVLHATDAGRPVYERMGYTAISSHTLFMEKHFLEGH